MKFKKVGTSPPVKLVTTLILVILQFVITVILLFRLTHSTVWLYVLFQVINFVVVFYIVNKRSNPSYKIMWIIFIMSIPPIGSVVYLLWGSGRVTPKFRRRALAVKKTTEKFLRQDPAVISGLEYNDLQHSRQAIYLKNQSGYPVWNNTETEFLSPGEKFFPRMLEELQKAEKFIFIEFFILAEGKMWDEVHSILRQKIRQGVEVRVIYDGFGSIMRQQHGFEKKLNAEGIKTLVFNPVRPSVDLFQNNRNHRKIIVVDGVVSMTGGINIGDEYINLTQPHGYWMDSAIILRGPATNNFTVMFCEMWNTITKKQLMDPAKYLPRSFDTFSDGFVQPYCDTPIEQSNPAAGIYMQILCSAKKYVYITSPYLILDNTMLDLIKSTAQSGVDVRIITPKIEDKWYVHPVTQSYYDELLSAGVKIYEFKPGFIHSKLFVSDDKVATVGTVNVDYRSFYLHFECGTWIADNKSVLDIKQNILRTMEDSTEIKLDEWRSRPNFMKVKQFVLRLFAPFM